MNIRGQKISDKNIAHLLLEPAAGEAKNHSTPDCVKSGRAVTAYCAVSSASYHLTI